MVKPPKNNKNMVFKKEVFSPMEDVTDITELRNIFQQIVQDVYSKNYGFRLTETDANKIKTLIENNDINIGQIDSLKPCQLKAVINEAKTFPFYFTRFFPVSCENFDGSNHLLAISHSGIKIVERLSNSSTNDANDCLSILETFKYSHIEDIRITTVNTINILLFNETTLIFHTQWVYDIQDLIETFLKESRLSELSHTKVDQKTCYSDNKTNSSIDTSINLQNNNNNEINSAQNSINSKNLSDQGLETNNFKFAHPYPAKVIKNKINFFDRLRLGPNSQNLNDANSTLNVVKAKHVTIDNSDTCSRTSNKSSASKFSLLLHRNTARIRRDSLLNQNNLISDPLFNHLQTNTPKLSPKSKTNSMKSLINIGSNALKQYQQKFEHRKDKTPLQVYDKNNVESYSKSLQYSNGKNPATSGKSTHFAPDDMIFYNSNNNNYKSRDLTDFSQGLTPNKALKKRILNDKNDVMTRSYPAHESISPLKSITKIRDNIIKNGRLKSPNGEKQSTTHQIFSNLLNPFTQQLSKSSTKLHEPTNVVESHGRTNKRYIDDRRRYSESRSTYHKIDPLLNHSINGDEKSLTTSTGLMSNHKYQKFSSSTTNINDIKMSKTEKRKPGETPHNNNYDDKKSSYLPFPRPPIESRTQINHYNNGKNSSDKYSKNNNNHLTRVRYSQSPYKKYNGSNNRTNLRDDYPHEKLMLNGHSCYNVGANLPDEHDEHTEDIYEQSWNHIPSYQHGIYNKDVMYTQYNINNNNNNINTDMIKNHRSSPPTINGFYQNGMSIGSKNGHTHYNPAYESPYKGTHYHRHDMFYYALCHFRSCLDKIKSDPELNDLYDRYMESEEDDRFSNLRDLQNMYFQIHDEKEHFRLITPSKKPIEKPLHNFENVEEGKLALDTFVAIMRYMMDLPKSNSEDIELVEMDYVYTLLTACHRYTDLQTEVYCQIIKQLGHSTETKVKSERCVKGWKLMHILTSYFLASFYLRPFLTHYITTVSINRPNPYCEMAKECLMNYEVTQKYGGRKNVPSVEEIMALSHGKSYKRQFYRIPGGGGRIFLLKCSSVIENVVKDICWDLLETKDTEETMEFALYIVYPSKKVEYISKDEYILDVTTELDKKYIADAKNGYFIFFKRHMWSLPLSFNTKGQCYIEFHYKQILADYLAGLIFMIPNLNESYAVYTTNHNNLHYPKIPQYIEDDLAELACLIHRASGAETHPNLEDVIFLFPETLLESPNFDKVYWHNVLLTIRKELNRLSPSEARIKFMQTLEKNCQLFGSTYFNVKNSYDSDAITENIFAINKAGIYFLPPNAQEILSHHPYRRIETVNKTTTPTENYIEIKVKTSNVLKMLKIHTEQCHEVFHLLNAYMRKDMRENS